MELFGLISFSSVGPKFEFHVTTSPKVTICHEMCWSWEKKVTDMTMEKSLKEYRETLEQSVLKKLNRNFTIQNKTKFCEIYSLFKS